MNKNKNFTLHERIVYAACVIAIALGLIGLIYGLVNLPDLIVKFWTTAN